MLFGTEAFEINILNGIRDAFGCPFADSVMTFFSVLGNSGILWILWGIALAISKKYRKWGVMLFVGLILGVLIGNFAIKNIIQRPRPCWVEENVQLLIEMPTDFSFPSAHTLSCFIAAFILLDANRKFGIPALIIAIITAFSRMYLFVHYPTDILGGIIFAALIYYAIKLLFRIKKVGN